MPREEKKLSLEAPGEWAAKKVLGPVLSEIGEDFKKIYAIGRDKIIEAAYKKLKNPNDGKRSNLRVTRDVLWNGAFTDEEICAEYFGGILANSRTEDGRSDELIQFVDVIKSLSSSQLRLHYYIYRSINQKLVTSKKNINVTLASEIQAIQAFFSTVEIQEIHGIDIAIGLNGLFRQGLLFKFKWDNYVAANIKFPYLSANPTTFGVLLYAVAHNRLEDSLNFCRVDFGNFDDVTFPKLYAFTLEELVKQAELPTQSEK